jgi:hypothetical protein
MVGPGRRCHKRCTPWPEGNTLLPDGDRVCSRVWTTALGPATGDPPLYQRLQKRLGPFMTSLGIGPKQYLLRWDRQPNSLAVQSEARLFFGVSGDPSVEQLAAIAEFYPRLRIVIGGT